MTQEEKVLLLKDLCSRLPYGVMIKHKNENGKKDVVAKLVGYNGDWFNYYIDELCYHLKLEEFKIYLRPMSSMTEEEKEEIGYFYYGVEYLDLVAVPDYIDWLLEHHFDYRGLIGKGLALEAPKGMYKTELL